jgi:hypothetical protein
MPGSIWWCTPPGSDSQREPRSCSPSKQASARRAARECVTQRNSQADTWGVGPTDRRLGIRRVRWRTLNIGAQIICLCIEFSHERLAFIPRVAGGQIQRAVVAEPGRAAIRLASARCLLLRWSPCRPGRRVRAPCGFPRRTRLEASAGRDSGRLACEIVMVAGDRGCQRSWSRGRPVGFRPIVFDTVSAFQHAACALTSVRQVALVQ